MRPLRPRTQNKMSLSEILEDSIAAGGSTFPGSETLTRGHRGGTERPASDRSYRDRSRPAPLGREPHENRDRPLEQATPRRPRQDLQPGQIAGRPRHGTPFPFLERHPQREVPRDESAYAPPARTRAAEYIVEQGGLRATADYSRSSPMNVDRAEEDTIGRTAPRYRHDPLLSPTPIGRRTASALLADTASERDQWEEGAARIEGDAETHSAAEERPWTARTRPDWDESDESGEEGDGLDALPLCMTQGPTQGLERPMPTPGSLVVPTIAIDDPEMFIRGLSDNWIRAIWMMSPAKQSLPIYIYNYRFTDSVSFHRLAAKALRAAAISITGNQEVRAVPPEPKREDDVRGDEALLWALRGLTDGDVHALRSRPVWSFPGITFFVLPKDIGPGRWAFSLEGFLDDDTEAIRRAVQHVLLEADNIELIQKLTRRNPEFRNMSPEQRVQEILASVTVTTWTTSNENVIANVFIHPPTRITRLWRDWIGRLRNRRYGNYTNGTGTVRRLSHCLGCRSADQPTHLCPYQDLAGWNGPDAGSGSFSRHVQPPLKRERRQQDRARPHPQTHPSASRVDRPRERRGGSARGSAPHNGQGAWRG